MDVILSIWNGTEMDTAINPVLLGVYANKMIVALLLCYRNVLRMEISLCEKLIYVLFFIYTFVIKNENGCEGISAKSQFMCHIL